MAKELPYFRFTVSEWLNDSISMESYECKGVFADVCAFYWFRDCSIDLATLEKRFRDAKEILKELISLDIIKVNDDKTVCIKFLDTQYDLLSEKRQKFVEAGRIGGLKRASNAKATLKRRSSYKDKDKDNNKKKDNNKFVPPTIEEVKEYFKEKGYTIESAVKAFDFYNVANWKDSKGNQVKNWKQKMISVWFKDENKKEFRNYERKLATNRADPVPEDYGVVSKDAVPMPDSLKKRIGNIG